MTYLDDWVGRNIPDVVLNDAAAWMALLDSERCHMADRVAFARWLDEDPCHQWAFEELSEVWARLHTLVDVRPAMSESNVVSMTPRIPRPAVPAAPPKSDWTALAATLLLVIGTAVHVLADKPMESHINPVGEVSQVILADGTSMNLNASSHVKSRFDGQSRYLELAAGDAVFDVQQESRPFVLKTRGATLTATETEFAVALTDESLQVAVIEGSVTIRHHDRLIALTEVEAETLSAIERSTTLLQAGEQLQITADQRRRLRFDQEKLHRQLSWRHGIMEFESQPLAAVVDAMRRYLDVNVHIADPELATLRIDGRFQTGDTAAFLRDLESNPAIMVERANERWAILRAPVAANSP